MLGQVVANSVNKAGNHYARDLTRVGQRPDESVLLFASSHRSFRHFFLSLSLSLSLSRLPSDVFCVWECVAVLSEIPMLFEGVTQQGKC